jgi:hypothetical protein
MTASPTVSAYSTAATALPDEYFLGQIVYFTITEADVPLEHLQEQIEQLGLRADRLKKRLRPIDAFKKAAGDVETKFRRSVDTQHAILVRPVGQDTQESHRHVVLERAQFRVGQRRRVVHDTVLKLIYSRGARDANNLPVGDGIHIEPVVVPGLVLLPEERAWLDRIVGDDGAALRQRYQHYQTHLDSHGVRSFVREYLNDLGAVNVKGNTGGLYFVHQKHAGEVRDLAKLVQGIGSQMHLIPLLDIVEQRDMLAEAFIADTLEEVRQLSAEMSRILDDPKRSITEKTYDDYAANAARLIEKARSYQQLLDRGLDRATIEVDVFQRKTLNLIQRIRRPRSLSATGGE